MTKSVSQIVHEAMGLKWSSITCRCMGTCGHSRQFPKNPNYLIHGPDWTAMIQWARDKDGGQFWVDFNKHITKENTEDTDLYKQVYDDVSIAYVDGVKDGVDNLARLIADPPALATKVAEYITDKEVGG